MPKLPILAGRIVAAALEKLGFSRVRQRGSHLVMKRVARTTDVCVVPLHKEVAVGTLRSVLRQAGVEPEEFLKVLASKVGKKRPQ